MSYIIFIKKIEQLEVDNICNKKNVLTELLCQWIQCEYRLMPNITTNIRIRGQKEKG